MNQVAAIVEVISFNPTLVRLRQDRSPVLVVMTANVSIPRWFD